MKRRRISLSAFTLALGFSAPAFAATNENPLCAAEEADVQRQMDEAREHGNTERLRGLETALKSIRSHCSDAKLLADAEEEVQESIDEVEERKQDLEEALQEGDKDEVEERQEKLKEATDELKEHMQELEALRSRR